MNQERRSRSLTGVRPRSSLLIVRFPGGGSEINRDPLRLDDLRTELGLLLGEVVITVTAGNSLADAFDRRLHDVGEGGRGRTGCRWLGRQMLWFAARVVLWKQLVDWLRIARLRMGGEALMDDLILRALPTVLVGFIFARVMRRTGRHGLQRFTRGIGRGHFRWSFVTGVRAGAQFAGGGCPECWN